MPDLAAGSHGEGLVVSIERVATGGAGVGRLEDGRVIFVDGALPLEHVRVEITRERKRHVEARALEIIEPSPHRVAPPCPHLERGCGGCDWQHVSVNAAHDLRRDIVVDCLTRIGRLQNPAVAAGPTLPTDGYRTVLRAAVVDGKAGFRKARAHDVVSVDSCIVAHPLAEEILVDGVFPGATEISIKVGARTSERLVVVDTTERCSVPDGVTIVGPGQDAFIHERIHGQALQISARSFFQCRPDGAEVLVDLVGNALGPALDSAGKTIVDAYGGVGLFGATLGAGHRVISLEASVSSSNDAEVNLATAGTARATVVRGTVEAWTPEPADVVIADPSRKGLGQRAIDVLAATNVPVLVLVSCDPASLGRDARGLIEAGFALESSTTIDLFGHTSHVEAVSLFLR